MTAGRYSARFRLGDATKLRDRERCRRPRKAAIRVLPLVVVFLLVRPGTVEADVEVYARCREFHRVLVLARLRSGGAGRRRRSGHRPLKYGSAKFDELADFARAFYGSLDTEERPWGILLSDWRRSLRTMDAVVRLPVVEVTFTPSPAGRTLQQFYGRRRFLLPTGRVAQAVLDVKPSREEYLRGRSRQALRTNVRKATSYGITCGNREPAAWSKEAETVPGALPLAELPDGLGSEGLLLCAASGPDGRTVAVASVLLDREVGWLLTMATSGRQHLQQSAKHLLHLHVVDEMRKRGVAYLWAGDALYLHKNIQYIQHIFGFDTVNLRATVRPSRGAAPGD